MVDGMVSALVVVRAVTGKCLGKEAQASCGRGRRRASSVGMKSGVRQRERSEVAFLRVPFSGPFCNLHEI